MRSLSSVASPLIEAGAWPEIDEQDAPSAASANPRSCNCLAISAGKARVLLKPYETPPFGTHALYPHSRHLAVKVRVLVDFLAERYRGKPRWEHGW